MALDNAREALALRGAGHIDLFAVGERGDGLGVAGLVLGSVLHAHLAQVTAGLDAPLVVMAAHRAVDLLLLDGAEAQLNSLVTIGFGGLHLADRVGLCLDYRDGQKIKSPFTNIKNRRLIQ